MDEQFKTLENFAILLQKELHKVASRGHTLNPNACRLVREASLDAITLYRKIEEARCWNLEHQNATKITL